MADKQPANANNTGNQPPQGGMKIEVTPQSPVARTTAPLPEELVPEHKSHALQIIIAAVIVLVLVAIVYFVVLPMHPLTTTTTSVSTTTVTTHISYLSGCGTLSTPGSYFLSNSIKTTAAKPCLNVTSSDVQIVCNGKSISGMGPFTGTGPFSYGVIAQGVSNVSVNGCTISNFSYGVYAASVTQLNLKNNNITDMYLNALYLNNTSGGTVQNNYFGYNNNQAGAIYMTNGSTNNQFLNNTLLQNVFLGFNIDSARNTFNNNLVSGSYLSFSCTPLYGFISSSSAHANSCYNQTGCNFLSCNGTNVQDNFGQISLGPNIESCGSINTPGMYSLNTHLNMKSYTNASLASLALYKITCISIKSNNVYLNCHNNLINNSYIGINVNAKNVTLANCNVRSSQIGLLLGNSSGVNVTGSTFVYDNYSVLMPYLSSARFNNINASFSNYGMYFKNATAVLVSNFTVDNNTFGMYFAESLSNIFSRGQVLNNTQVDILAAADSANQSDNFMSGTACGVTNAAWAPCLVHTSNIISFNYQLTNCQYLRRPGTYNLAQNIVPAGSLCVVVASNNILVNCKNMTLQANPFTPGPGILINGRNNVTLNNCVLTGYNTGIMIANSSKIKVNGARLSGIGTFGIALINDTGITVSGSKVSGPSNASIMLSKVTKSSIINNNVSQGTSTNVGILVLNSTQNLVNSNFGIKNNVGIYFAGQSTNNTASNNFFTQSFTADYKCDPVDTPLNAGNGGVNSGVSEIGCWWLATIPPGGVAPLGCAGITSPSFINLHNDNVYAFANTCFSVFANGTTIDCNGATILATNGGTFAKFTGVTDGKIQDCYLKGFTTPIVATGANSIIIFNNTIFVNSTLKNSQSAAINLTGSLSGQISNNNITTPYVGIYASRIDQGLISNNNVTGGTSYYITLTNATQIINNVAQPSSGIGAVMNQSFFNYLKLNTFSGITSGLWCIGGAEGTGNNTDAGDNTCSSNTNCAWITSSSGTCR